MGVASLILAIVSLSNVVLEIIVSVTAYQTFQVREISGTPFSSFIGWWNLFIILMSLCGIVFGIGGMRQPHRRRRSATIGLCTNIAIPLALMFILVLAISMDSSSGSEAAASTAIQAGSDRSPTLVAVATFLAVVIAGMLMTRTARRKRLERHFHSTVTSSLVCRTCAKAMPVGMKFCRRCGSVLLN